MTPPVQRIYDAGHVELDRAMFHLGAVGTTVDEHPACRAGSSWQPDAAGIEHPDTADLPIRRIVRVTAHHPIGIETHEETADLLVRRCHVEPRTIIRGRRCVNTQQSCAVEQLDALTTRVPIEGFERACLVEDTSCPRGASSHEAVPPHKVDIGHSGFRRRVGMRLIVGEHISVGVPGDERDIVELGEHLQHLDRMRPEQHKITEHPPPLDPETFTVAKDRTESVGDAVDVGDDPKSHVLTVPAADESAIALRATPSAPV